MGYGAVTDICLLQDNVKTTDPKKSDIFPFHHDVFRHWIIRKYLSKLSTNVLWTHGNFVLYFVCFYSAKKIIKNSARTPREPNCHTAQRNEMHRTKPTADTIPLQSEESNINSWGQYTKCLGFGCGGQRKWINDSPNKTTRSQEKYGAVDLEKREKERLGKSQRKLRD